MEVSDAKTLKALEAENANIKKLLAEQMMDASTLKEMLGKTSKAWCAATCCELGHDTKRVPSAAGLRLGGD
jgi:putative transposase